MSGTPTKSIRSAVILAMLLALAIPMISVAQKADKPGNPQRGPYRPDGPGNKLPKAGMFGPPVKFTPEELDTAREFARKNFPSFYEMYSRLPENGPMRMNMSQRMVGRYRNMMRMQEQNPELYDTMLSQARLEDEAIGYAREMRNGKTETAKAEAESKLRKTVAQIIDKNLSARQQHIEKLRAMLAEQERQLKDDQDNKDQIIAQQIDRTQKQFDGMLRGNIRGPAPGQVPDGVNTLQQ